MKLLEGTRIGTLIQTLLQLTGLPIFGSKTLGNLNSTTISPLFSSTTTQGGNLNMFRSLIDLSSDLNIELGTNQDIILNNRDLRSEISVVNEAGNFESEWKCYENLTCLKLKYPDLRGFKLWPAPLALILPTICFYYKTIDVKCKIVKNVQDLSEIDGLELPLRTNYWVTHGYLENGQRTWIKEMISELLKVNGDSSDIGVFSIDWGRGAEPPYAQATVNIELLAIYVGHLMLELHIDQALDLNSTHFIGHSLGAHFGGLTGAWIKIQGFSLSRITGLDPANPYFQFYPLDARLDQTDADFVDVIHTDAKPLLHGGTLTGLGTQEKSGHLDFYPNSGKDQPGCRDGVYQAILQEDGSLIHGLRRMIVCDHIRAYEYFTESIRSACPFQAYPCSSWTNFLKNPKFCQLESNKMGFHAKNLRNNQTLAYYLLTGDRSPYCRYHYFVTISLENEIFQNQIQAIPELLLLLLTENSEKLFLNLDMKNVKRFENKLQWLVTGTHLAGNPTIGYFGYANGNNPLWWILNRINKPSIKVISIEVSQLESENLQSLRFCPESFSELSLDSMIFSEKSQEKYHPIKLTTMSCSVNNFQIKHESIIEANFDENETREPFYHMSKI